MTVARRAAWLWVIAFCASSSSAASPAATPEQIESDWLRQAALRAGKAAPRRPGGQGKITRRQDATGAVDGRINGGWGFHTANENKPWWQVDLGRSAPLDRVVLYNRCEKGMAARNARILVLLSEDGKSFQQAYQHDGTTFLGFTDKKPLIVKLTGRKGRFVRLQLPGRSYFHLDEVQVFAPGRPENIALGRPATQSSVSQWSTSAAKPGAAAPAPQPSMEYPTAQVVERGGKLAAELKDLGAKIDPHADALRRVAKRLAGLPADAPEQTRRELYLQARWAVRKMALGNPLLDFEQIVFTKRAPGLFPHASDQYYGWWSRGGGGMYVLSGFKGDTPAVRCLTADWPTGNFLRPDLSYDGKKVLFAYCKHYPHVAGVRDKTKKDELPDDAFYHLYEMNLDGAGVRQLTRGRYDDFDGRYLPTGDIVFLSTRKGTALQAGKRSAEATAGATQPDSYVRCGGGNHRPVAVFTLHRMDAEGGALRAISAFESFEWTPAVMGDGRIAYARWDYIDRFNGPFFSLWSTNPDGTNAQLLYGNYTKKPQCTFEPRAIPNSRKLILTASAHHSITGGSLVLMDRARGSEFERPLTRLTPEVSFPETEGWPRTYYANPWPLSERHFLVAWSDRPLPRHRLMRPDDPNNPRNAMGIYLYDALGNLNLLHRDPEISSMYPIPARPRPAPRVSPDLVDWDGPQEGTFLLQDVYNGLPGVPRGSIARLRVVAVSPKVQPSMNSPVLGVSREDPGKFILGTVPVESDGSAFFRVPSGVPVLFQALDRDGLAVQTMRSLTYVQPNQTLSCVGCHESRAPTPPPRSRPLAAGRPPAKLTLDPDGSWPLRYDRLVQPVLDKHCISCHRSGAKDPKAARYDLTGARSYANLLAYGGGDLRKLAFEKDVSIVGDCPARKSKLLAMLTQPEGHEGVRLDADSRYRLAVWMDTYAYRQGAFSSGQEDQLRQLKRAMAHLLAK